MKALNEKIRPKNLKEIILLDRVKGLLPLDGIPKKSMLFSGHAGIGKSTLARIYCKDHDVMFLNASTDAGIDTLRNKITDFCSTNSIEYPDKPKIVFLDEFDGASKSFYDGLRAIMEKWTDVIFIATCNYLNKIPDPMQSRFSPVIEFDPKNESEVKELEGLYAKRVKLLSKKLDIKWQDKKTLISFVKESMPDMRKIISMLQVFVDSGIKTVTMKHVKDARFIHKDLFDMLISNKTKPVDVYKKSLSEYYASVDEVFISLGLDFPKYLIENNKIDSLGDILPLVGQWSSMTKKIPNPILALNGCLVSIIKVMSKY